MLPLPPQISAALRRGLVIPAHPLALTANRQLDEKHQRALTRYYCAAGVGGIAVGVHTTQFAIRHPQSGLYQPVLTLAAETIDEFVAQTGKAVVKIAGIAAGPLIPTVKEARFAVEQGYHLGLVSLGGLPHDFSNTELIAHLLVLSDIIPLMGFYLQPAVGGRILDVNFWRRAAEIENLLAIKIAPFNRYQTLEVVRAVAESGRAKEIALYTGNDDNIVIDLLTKFSFEKNGKTKRIVGGLLGHWAVWTKQAVTLLKEIHDIVENDSPVPNELLTRAQQITDANAAFFDPPHNFAGCIAGLHEVLRRQGLMAGRWTLNPNEDLSPGQMEEIDRVYQAYPHLHDDGFVAENLAAWLR